MTPSARQRQNGYILLPVVLTLALIAMFAFLMNSESTLENRNISSDLEQAQVRYLAQSGINHALWQLTKSGCGPYTDINSHTFGQGSYSISFAANNAGGQTTTYTATVSDDAWIKSETPDQNYGNDAQLSTYYDSSTGNIQRALYRFNLASANIPQNSLLVSAVLKLYIIDSNTNAAVTVHQITADWTEADVTWNTINDKYNSTASATIASAAPAGQIIKINLTPLVQGWLNGSVSNQGIMLRTTAAFDLAQYASKEYGTFSQQPQLEITVSDGSIANRADITVNATLNNGINQTVSHNNVVLYQAALNTLQQQPNTFSGKDTWVNQNKPTNNYGITREMVIDGSSSEKYFLGYFNLTSIPFNARIVSAQLDMHLNYIGDNNLNAAFTVYEMLHDWQEGSGDYWNPGSGADWNTYDAVNSWSWQTNNDLNHPIATSPVNPAFVGWQNWDIKELVQKWISGKSNNYGFVIKGNSSTVGAGFASSDYFSSSKRPRLTVNYVCECGIICQSPQGSGNLLLVVGDSASMSAGDASRLALFKSWGYNVSIIDDDDTQANFDNAIANNKAAYISNSINSATLETKLTNPPIGIINESSAFMSPLGIASGYSYAAGKTFDIIDNSHYITSVFPDGAIPFYSKNMHSLNLTGGLATEQQTLVKFNGSPALIAIESKNILSDGSTKASGRRVALPTGNSNFNWQFTNNNVRLLIQRSLQWAIDGIPYIVVPKKIYWTDDDGQMIQRSDEDGSNIETIISGQYKVRGMDIDTDNGKIYWSSDDQLKRANLDGSNIETIYTAPYKVIFDVKLDVASGKVYWDFDNYEQLIMRANLDGSNAETINNTINQGAYFSIDPDSGFLYITQFGDGSIVRTNLDGSNPVTIADGPDFAVGNALDTNNGKVYWTGGMSNDWIKRANIDGSDVETIITGLTSPQDIDYDTDNEKIYWTDPFTQSILRANPDGTNVETIVTNRIRPRGIKIVSASLVPETGPAIEHSSCSGTFSDHFNTVSYSNNDGSLNWSSDWIEINESNGPSLGDEQIVDDNGAYQLQIKDNDGGGEGVVRELNLSGASSALLSFDYRRSKLDNSNDYVSVSISPNGSSGPWIELIRFTGQADDSSYSSYSQDISAFISTRTQIQLLSSPSLGNLDSVYFDNIEISCSP